MSSVITSCLLRKYLKSDEVCHLLVLPIYLGLVFVHNTIIPKINKQIPIVMFILPPNTIKGLLVKMHPNIVIALSPLYIYNFFFLNTHTYLYIDDDQHNEGTYYLGCSNY